MAWDIRALFDALDGGKLVHCLPLWGWYRPVANGRVPSLAKDSEMIDVHILLDRLISRTLSYRVRNAVRLIQCPHNTTEGLVVKYLPEDEASLGIRTLRMLFVWLVSFAAANAIYYLSKRAYKWVLMHCAH